MAYVLLTPELYETWVNTYEGSKDVTVTAKMAQTILDAQTDPTKNFRDSKGTKVSMLVDYITTEQWYPAIAVAHIDRGGNVLNGMHTLKSIIQSGYVRDLTMHFGVPDEANDYFDPTSQGRTPAQHMNKLGYKIPGAAQVLSIVHNHGLMEGDEPGKLDGRKNRQDNRWLTETAAATPAFQRYARQAYDIVKRHPVILPGHQRAYTGAALKAVAILLLNAGHREETVSDFYAGLSGTKRDGADDPRLKTIETLADIPNVASSASSVEKSVLVILHGFKKWIINEPTRNKFNWRALSSREIPSPGRERRIA